MGGIDIHKKFRVIRDIVEARYMLKDGNLTAEKKAYYTNLLKVDTIVITGGRNSFKSFTTSLLLVIFVAIYDFQVLFTRYTLSSASDSVIPEVQEKIDLLNFGKKFSSSRGRIFLKNKKKRGQIVFRGIKVGSKNQTANLKSLKNFNVFMLDEAEEHPNYADWRKIFRSIRRNDIVNLSILVLNPTSKEHWIYKNFFEKKGLDKGHNGIIDNVAYIHMIYTDMPEFVAENIKRDFERQKIEDPIEFEHTVMGGFMDMDGSLLYNRSFLNYFDIAKMHKFPIYKCCWIDTADSGTDNFAMPVCYIFRDGMKLNVYVVDILYNNDDMSVNEDVASEIINRHRLDEVGYETNQFGAYGLKNLQAKIFSPIVGKFETVKKHSRIISQSGIIKKYFYFRKDSGVSEEYKNFMKDFCKYPRDGKKRGNIDAPDSLAGASTLIRQKFDF